MKEGKNVGRKEGKESAVPSFSPSYLPAFLLGLCLCVLALRVTYTESPTVQASTLPMNIGDTLHSLTLSGILLLGLVIWFVRAVFSSRLSYRVTGLEIGLVLFVAAGVVAAWTAADKRLALSQVSILLGPILAALLIVQLLHAAGRAGIILMVIAALGIVSTYQCVEQLAVSNRILEEQYEKAPQTILEPMGIEAGSFENFLFEHRLYSGGIRGFFTTSNTAASFGLIACFAAFALLASRKGETSGGRSLLYPAIATAILIAGVLLTKSKGGIIGFLAAALLLGVLLAWLRQPPARRKSLLIAGGLLCAVALAAIAFGVISYGMRHGRLPGGNSMLVRWQYWDATGRMIADHPWTGVGPGNFATYYMHYKPAAALESVADPHCLPLSLLAQYGPLGLIGFLAMVFLPLGGSLLSLTRGTPAPSLCWSASKRSILLMLGALCAFFLIVRPILIPLPPDNSLELFIYNAVSLYVAPAAAFLIGFVLLVVPFPAAGTTVRPRSGPAIVALLACAVIGVLLHSLIDFALFEPGVWMAFWIVMACLICLGRSNSPRVADLRMDSTGRKMLALAISVILLGSYLAFIWLPVSRSTANIQRARDEASAGRLDNAHRFLEAADKADALNDAALSLDGNLYLQQYEQASPKQPALLRSAAERFEKAIQINAADYKNYEKMGLTLSLLGQDQQAYDWYAKAASRYPGNERLWLRLGQMADRMGQRDAAVTHYRKAVEIEDAFRSQFRKMYPKWEKPVSRLGEPDYQLALKRIRELSGA